MKRGEEVLTIGEITERCVLPRKCFDRKDRQRTLRHTDADLPV